MKKIECTCKHRTNERQPHHVSCPVYEQEYERQERNRRTGVRRGKVTGWSAKYGPLGR